VRRAPASFNQKRREERTIVSLKTWPLSRKRRGNATAVSEEGEKKVASPGQKNQEMVLLRKKEDATRKKMAVQASEY